MDIRKLQRAIVDGLEDVKAQNIVVFNTEHLSPLFERVIIASGTSNRQTKALASSVRDAVKSSGFPVMRTEGEDNGEWIIVDCGAAVAHIMQPAIRDYYHLEEIWGSKPVRMKIAAATTALVKAAPVKAEPARGASAKAAPVKSAAKAAPRRAAAGPAAPAAPAGRAPRKTTTAPSSRAGVQRTVGTKSTAARKGAGTAAAPASPSRTRSTAAPAARKAPARKTAPAAPRRAPARKTPARG